MDEAPEIGLATTDLPFVSDVGDHPVRWALVGFFVAWTCGWSLHRLVFAGSFWPSAVSSNRGWIALATAVTVALAGFVLCRFIFYFAHVGRHEKAARQARRSRALTVAAGTIIVNMAIGVSIAACSLAFREESPWKGLLEGISGPGLPVDSQYWPVLFVAVMVTITVALRNIWLLLLADADLLLERAAVARRS